MKGNHFSTRDYEDVLEGRLFLVDVSDATREHVMMTIRKKASELVKGKRCDSRDFPWYLKKELEEAIDNVLR
jgi:hypothetical protein